MFRFDGMIVFGTGLRAPLRRFLYYDDTNGISLGQFSVILRSENQFRAMMSFFDTGFSQVSLFVECRTNRTHDGGLRNSFGRIGDVYMGKSYSLACHAMLGVVISLYDSLSSPPLTVTCFVPRSRSELLFSNRNYATPFLLSSPFRCSYPLMLEYETVSRHRGRSTIR
jgi:hypothetical protein